MGYGSADDIQVRRSRPGDAEAMRQLVLAAYEHYVERIGRPPGPMLTDYSEVASAGNVWVAELSGQIVGLLVLVVSEDHLLLENLAVSPTVQGQGLGGRLLRLADTVAERHALPEIRLYTNEAMTENLAFYPRHGYHETHRQTDAGYRRVFFSRHVPSACHRATLDESSGPGESRPRE